MGSAIPKGLRPANPSTPGRVMACLDAQVREPGAAARTRNAPGHGLPGLGVGELAKITGVPSGHSVNGLRPPRTGTPQ